MPTTKVSAGALAGALTIIIVWALNSYAHLTIPGEVGSAITTVITLITSYFVKD